MSRSRAFGVYDGTLSKVQASARRRAIESHCRKESLPTPTFTTPDFFETTVRAADLAQDGQQVVIVGALDDLHIPADSHDANAFTEHEWREAWLAYLHERAVGWSPVRGTAAPSSPQSNANRQSIVRSYQRSCLAIARLLSRIRSKRKVGARSKEPGYVYGRPPYGYRVIKGHLQPDKERIKLVKTMFEYLQEGRTVTDTALALQVLNMGRDGKKEYWDPVKIRRILRHAALYCRGEYTSPTGKTVRLASLAILPESWFKIASARCPKPFPKESSSGTMGLLTHATH